MGNFIRIHDRVYNLNLIQGLEKDFRINRQVNPKKGRKWYQIFSLDVIETPTFIITLEYGTNHLKKVEGHFEHSHASANEFYVPSYETRNVEYIKINFLNEKDRDDTFEKILNCLNDLK